jgi:hypothetical protein
VNIPSQIQEQVYHCQGPSMFSKLPSDCPLKYFTSVTVSVRRIQIYTLYHQYAESIRCANSNSELDEYIIEHLAILFYEHNPFAIVYKTADGILQNKNKKEYKKNSRCVITGKGITSLIG